MNPAFPEGRCLPEFLLDRAQAHPDATAVIRGDDAMSYRRLVESSRDVAAYLLHLGVVPDDRVGLFVEPSSELMVGAWGILRSGGAYLPLSPEYPEERLRYMIEDSRTGIVFTQRQLKEKLAALAPRGTRIVTLEDAAGCAEPLGTSGEDACAPGLRPDHLAYVIYTSGSTGKPKGVMIEHRSIVNQMQWMHEVCGLDRGKTVLQKTPMSFDAAQWEILAPACGSRVVMGTPGVYRDPERLMETVIRNDVTTLQCVPTLLQALVDAEEFRDCTSLTQVFSGGEALSKNLAVQFLDALPQCDLVNLYGPTECTINSSAFVVDRNTVADGPHAISIGSPVHRTEYHVLDDSRVPVAVGEVGELYISGVQLARGYLHRPELTADRFIANPFSADPAHPTLYRTGDLVSRNADGTLQFAGRTDNQVKLRGFRVELDEIRLPIESHDWVKNAAIVVKDDPRSGFQNLIAFVELNPREAALMDQGNHGAHHQSKTNKLQVKAQLSNMGCRGPEELRGKPVVDLPGREPAREQRRQAFSRKTYRFFEGGEVTRADVLRLLERRPRQRESRGPRSLGFGEIGQILRYFGQYLSDERLLPKYGYASPGSLYATQMYLDLNGIGGLEPGCYYYHPVKHQLVLVQRRDGAGGDRFGIHFIGRKRAIEPVYKNNIREVLEIEAGHMVGLFEEVLPGYGLGIRPAEYTPAVKDGLECADEDYYLGSFELVPGADGTPSADPFDIYVQAHPGRIADLPAGQYRYRDGDLERISDELVLRKHVIAINQAVYDRSSLGITVIRKGPDDWSSYVDLGRKLQRLQMNDLGLGFMSSGYSSKSGNDLPSARRMESVLAACGEESGPSYFFVGGRVSEEQIRSEGMKEDVVHMKGPAEMIRDDLVNFLPDYMMPNRVVVLDEMPLTANGKIDLQALEKRDVEFADRPFVRPRTITEQRISDLWKKEMKRETVSVLDDFFESGGNSLIAVGLINKMNKEFQRALPLQVLFESPTVEKLAHRLDALSGGPSSRLVRLHGDGAKKPVFCWPGLGGYTMNLRLLAGRVGLDRPFYGVQAHGINQDETPFAAIKDMAAEDIKEIKHIQPNGPYTLWGYSFGARVAFETAYQLEKAGDEVENLFLIAPGSPKVRSGYRGADATEATYHNEAYVTILYSVFSGSISDPALAECLKVAKDEESFASYISGTFNNLDVDLAKRIMKIVYQTFQFKYAFRELVERRITAPVTIFKARGDDYSFIENSSGYSAKAPTVVNLEADHYSMLREPDIDELVNVIHHRLSVGK